jgi:NTP pyrophosphatase (non-canonical NTP hydrolase)
MEEQPEQQEEYTLNCYQKDASRTLAPNRRLDNNTLAMGGLGMAGETGEVVDLIKKVVAHGHELDQHKLIEELGDVMWYIAALCTLMGVGLEDVAFANIAKIKRRYPNGFDPNRSINRSE